ncbi:MAG: uncharacterized protein KVP18_001406 [Porospora cf. gigantea A]|uniref:uncharacterized protein n=1 Tax=Porospora cf. gigantea A TaxID=2853593 RepID=UPI00355AA77A|nr:MAG: hypothetical protein KVP18_001406 [Porospora cf. gigantea A]
MLSLSSVSRPNPLLIAIWNYLDSAGPSTTLPAVPSLPEFIKEGQAYKCTECDFTRPHALALQSHYLVIHKQHDPWTVLCTTSSRGFSRVYCPFNNCFEKLPLEDFIDHVADQHDQQPSDVRARRQRKMKLQHLYGLPFNNPPPLDYRHIYLQHSSPLTDSQVVHVVNAPRADWEKDQPLIRYALALASARARVTKRPFPEPTEPPPKKIQKLVEQVDDAPTLRALLTQNRVNMK